MGDSGAREQTETNGSDRARALMAGGKVAGIIPQNFDDCYRIAKILAVSGMVPDHFRDKPEAACVAIMQGLEVGLAPMAALQSIAVINGRPAIWGDGALAIVRASGLLEFMRETDDGATATCEVKRKGESEWLTRTFSVNDAKMAGLSDKKGPWQQYPARMRQMRARSWALRDGFADVLKGLHIAEEAQDIPMRDITPTQPAIEHQPADQPPASVERKSSAEGKRDGGVKRFNAIADDIKKCTDAQQCIGMWKMHRAELASMYRAWFDTLCQDFMVKLEDFGVIIDIDDYGWPILPKEEVVAQTALFGVFEPGI